METLNHAQSINQSLCSWFMTVTTLYNEYYCFAQLFFTTMITMFIIENFWTEFHKIALNLCLSFTKFWDSAFRLFSQAEPNYWKYLMYLWIFN